MLSAPTDNETEFQPHFHQVHNAAFTWLLYNHVQSYSTDFKDIPVGYKNVFYLVVR